MRCARLLVLCFFVFSLPAFADDLSSLTQFRTAVFTDTGTNASLAVRDVTRDGIADVVSCSQGSAFVLTRSGTALTPSWFSEVNGCTAATAGDATGDGYADVIVGASIVANTVPVGGAIIVYDPQTLGPAKARVVIPGSNPVADIAYGDVDRDGRPEIIAVTSADTFVYDAATLTLEWSALGKGGSKVALGDLEGDGGIEIVVNGNYGHVLDAQAQVEKWGYVGGFGRAMAVGDVDQDGRAEIAFLTSSPSDTITFIEGDTFQVSTLAVGYADRLAIADANGDGVPELIAGSYYSSVRGIRRSNGQVLWSIAASSYSPTAMAVGDVDGDSAPDVIWTASGGFYIGSATTQTIKWRSGDLDGDLGAVIADLDGDGKPEMIVKTTSTENGIGGGAIQIFDVQTRALKYSIVSPGGYSRRFYRLAVAQMDADPALEIIALGQDSYTPYLYVFDGVTGALEYQSPYTPYYTTPSFNMTGLWVGNVDGDATNEIVVGTTDARVEVLNGASAFIQWSSATLDGSITDIAVADVDHDGTLEIVAATGGGFWVFNAATGAVRAHVTSVYGVNHVAATSEGGGYIAVSSGNGGLQLYSGTSTPVWECTFSYPLVPTALNFYKLSGELRLATGDTNGNLRFYPLTGTACPTPLLRNVGRVLITGIGSYETTGDTNPELLIASYYAIELDSFSLSRYARGDFDGDGVVTDADIDALALYLYGGGPGSGPAADVNSDGAVAADDLFYLINYKRGTGPAPLP